MRRHLPALPLCRASIGPWRAPRVRGFASSPPARLGLSTPFEVTSDIFHAIHDVTGLTYGIAIPLTAVLLRTAVTLPASIHGYLILNRRLELRPLVLKWGSAIGRLTVVKFKQKNPNVDLKTNEEAVRTVSKMVHKTLKRKMNQIYKEHKCTRLRAFIPALLQIPLFVTASVTLRAMSGWGDWFHIAVTVPVEPLLHSEGFASIVDLTQPDASFILPVMLGLLNVMNVEMTAAKRGPTLLAESQWAQRFRVALRISSITVSLLFIPLAMQVPAALSLYWVASASFSLIQNFLMQKYLPTPPIFIARYGVQRMARVTALH